MSITKICDFDEACTLWSFRLPVADVQDLAHVNSKYSDEFLVGGVSWRIHVQQRAEPASKTVFLAIHLQCLTQDPRGTFAHFKLTVCNVNADQSKEKTFHCQFKKYGSAWGLHHFIELERLLDPNAGFIDYSAAEDGRFAYDLHSTGRSGGQVTPVIHVDALIRVMQPEADGTYALANLPAYKRTPALGGLGMGSAYSSPAGRSTGGGLGASARSGGGGGGVMTVQAPAVAPLQYPYDDALCDMTFALQGDVGMKAHRCVIACRAPRLIPDDLQPLPDGALVSVDASVEVFRCLLRFIYTEEPPERGVLRPEYLIDLYMLAMRLEYTLLAEHCVAQVTPLLTHDNILHLIASRYSPHDEILNVLYVRILASGYDRLIEDEHFEKVPGPLNRRVSLILRGKEPLPAIAFPKAKFTLASNLAMLAESGAYSDLEIAVPNMAPLRAHRVVLASRSVSFNHALYHRTPNASLPRFDGEEYGFTQQAWQRFLVSLYRGTSEPLKELSAEDVAIVWKLHDAMTLDGRLRRESEAYVTPSASARLLVYAEKHNIPKLRDVASRLVAGGFSERVRADPAVWDLIGELSHPTLLNLFRTVITEGS
jgi:hypothetical protein